MGFKGVYIAQTCFPDEDQAVCLLNELSRKEKIKMTIMIWLVCRLEDVCDDELPDKTEIKTDKSSPTVVFLEDIPRHPKNDVLPQKILDAMYVDNV